MRLLATVTAAVVALVAGLFNVLAQAAPADPSSQFIITLISQLGTSGVIVVILLKIRKEDESRHQSNRESDRTEREKDRSERVALVERVVDMAEKSTAVAHSGTEIVENRREADADKLIDKLKDVLEGYAGGRGRT